MDYDVGNINSYKEMTAVELRPYQEKAQEKIFEEWDKGHKKTLITMATGTGKTQVMASVARKVVDSGGKVLLLAHTGELLDQARDKFWKAQGLETSLEKAGETSIESDAPVTVGSIQTLSHDNRLALFKKDDFTTVMIDEAHHCMSDSYQKVLKHFDGAYVLGVTATPDRGDKRVLSDYFDSDAFDYNMGDAIKDKWLAPIRAQTIPLELDISNVGMVNGDYSAGETGDAIEPYLEQIAEEMKTYCHGRKTVVFLPLIRTAQAFCHILQEKGFTAAEVNGKSPDRDQILKDFDDGKYQVLCNAMLLKEGWDCPSVDCVVILRPTKIRSLYSQMVGRGSRLYPGKKDLLLLDFLWLTEKHDLCHPSAVIAADDDEAQRMNRMIQESDEGMDILNALEKADQERMSEREASLAAVLRANQGRERRLIDPIALALAIGSEKIAGYEPVFAWEREAPTEMQLDSLKRYGISAEQVTNKGYASAMLGAIIERSKEGLATPKQVMALKYYGYNDAASLTFEQASEEIGRLKESRQAAGPTDRQKNMLARNGFQEVDKWTRSEASEIIGILAANGWNVPKGIDPAVYRPKRLING